MVECAGSNWGSPQGLLRAQVSVLWALLLLILPTDLPHCSGHQRGRLSKGQSLTQDKELESRARKSVLCCFLFRSWFPKPSILYKFRSFIRHLLSTCFLPRHKDLNIWRVVGSNIWWRKKTWLWIVNTQCYVYRWCIIDVYLETSTTLLISGTSMNNKIF